MRSMGLDVGDRRIGVALSDSGGILASPFTIIECSDLERDIKALNDIVRQQEVGQIVVGLPRSMSGEIGHQARKVQDFVEVLRARVGIPVEFRDERLTSVSAKRLMQHTTRRKGRRKVRYDAAAAAIILQGYLEEQR